MELNCSLSQWQDVRVALLAEGLGPEGSPIYAKTISVIPAGEGCEATVRFTSVSHEVHEIFPRNS